MLIIVAGILVVAVLIVAYFSTARLAQFGASPTGERLERVQESSQWDGAKFDCPIPTKMAFSVGEYGSMLSQWFRGNEQRTPTGEIPVVEIATSTFAEKAPEGVQVTWLGHSTLLIEIDGFRVLTDPVWSERCSPFSIIGPTRFFPPPISIDSLPRLDAVIVSHDHFDHLDMEAAQALARTGVNFYVPLGVGAHLDSWGVDSSQIVEFDWWDSLTIGDGGLDLIATPARHFSGRGFRSGTNSTLFTTWVIKTAAHRLFFSGDTGEFPGLAEIGRRYGPFDLTMLKIGAYSELWPDIHLNPEQAVEVHHALGGELLLPIHWGTFNLAYHSWTEPPERLLAAAETDSVAVVTPRPGQSISIASPPPVDFWWRKVD